MTTAPDHKPAADTSTTLRTNLVTARDTATRALGDAREQASGVLESPLAILLGGIALGAIAGTLLPRSDGEKKLLAPVGQRINGAAREAMGAAREAGMGHLDELGINRDTTRDQFKTLIDGLLAALSKAGAAAAQSASGKVAA